MALDEATAAFLAQMAESGGPPIHEMSVAEARGLMHQLRAYYGPGPHMARVEDARVAVAPETIQLFLAIFVRYVLAAASTYAAVGG